VSNHQNHVVLVPSAICGIYMHNIGSWKAVNNWTENSGTASGRQADRQGP